MTATAEEEESEGRDVGIRDAAERLRCLMVRAPAGEPLPTGELEKALKPLLRSSFRRRGARETSRADCTRREEARRATLLPLVRDPRTPPDVLARVLEWMKDSVRYGLSYRAPEGRLIRALAANPNAPPEVLAECAAVCSKEFCRNPTVPLLVLADPSFAGLLSADGAGRVLRRADVPGPLLAAFAAGQWGVGRPDDPDRAEEARLHVGLAGEAAPASWEAEARGYWRRYAAALPEWTEREVVCDLAAVGFEPARWLTGVLPSAVAAVDAVTAALDPGADAGMLLRTTNADRVRGSVAVHAALALNPSTTAPLRARLPRRLAGYSLEADSPEAARALLREAVTRWYVTTRPGAGMPLLNLLLFSASPRATTNKRLHQAVVSSDWRMRLVAALTTPAARTEGRNLLTSLTGDGNRLVRAAACARLEDPLWRFVM